MKKLIAKLTLINIFISSMAFANSLTTSLGLIQPLLLKGGNVEVSYFTEHFVFDYSHGFSLHIPPSAGEYKDKEIELFLPYSTGFGIGYRFTSTFDTRLEFKEHQFHFLNAQSGANNSTVAKITTTTIGLGLYYHWFPFSTEKWNNFIVTSSLRYWPTVNPSKSKKVELSGARTGESVSIPEIGIMNSPIIFNVSVGYSW